MSQIPNFEIGRDSTSLTLYKQTVASDGTLSNDTAFGSYDLMLFGQVESVRPRTESRTSNLTPMNSYEDNLVPIGQITTWTIAGLIRRGVTNAGRKLAYASAASPVYVVATWAHADAIETFVASVTGFDGDFNREGSRFTLTLTQAALLNAPNPVISGTA